MTSRRNSGMPLNGSPVKLDSFPCKEETIAQSWVSFQKRHTHCHSELSAANLGI